jgi:hypothetical protein
LTESSPSRAVIPNNPDQDHQHGYECANPKPAHAYITPPLHLSSQRGSVFAPLFGNKIVLPYYPVLHISVIRNKISDSSP